jgi:hypothetical protein
MAKQNEGKTPEEIAAESAALAAANNAALENKQPPKGDEAKPDPNAALLARLDKQEQMINDLTTQLKTPAKPAPPKVEGEGVDISTLLFTDPERAVAHIEKTITDKLTNAYNGQKGVDKFFNDFYRSNNDLDPEEDDWLVKATLNQHPELYDMPVKQSRKQLGELVRERMLGFAKRAKGPNPPIVEGGNNTPPPKPPKGEEDEKPVTLTSLNQQRRAARLASGRPGAKA